MVSEYHSLVVRSTSFNNVVIDWFPCLNNMLMLISFLGVFPCHAKAANETRIWSEKRIV